ncbi:hypothetical protein I7I50_07398 [Histoplasma capsulatum G186AR]|uniref:Uncharacterized protein n=1 Tax=Ajellomyces capsulatus TaxID=5037 RepID=A0A8H7YVJ5_AJECA|nr:hypothetical protein I7I52_09529 [Histoplasma capsulatum]QSS68105.1 hypothetical protein I7I50_07398 [Histoplasma capsulatum G186AR]
MKKFLARDVRPQSIYRDYNNHTAALSQRAQTLYWLGCSSMTLNYFSYKSCAQSNPRQRV